MSKPAMVTRKKWSEFQKTGLLFLVNSILHVFGWAIVIETDEEGRVRGYPARVRFRGFDSKTATRSYVAMSDYMVREAKQLLVESEE